MLAAREALEHSGLSFADGLSERTATIIGTGVGGQNTQDDNYKRLYREGAKRLHPLTIPKTMANAGASHISMEFGITGPSYTVSTACSSASHAIGQIFRHSG